MFLFLALLASISHSRSISWHRPCKLLQKFNMCNFVASTQAFVSKAVIVCDHWCLYIVRHRALLCVLQTHVWKPAFKYRYVSLNTAKFCHVSLNTTKFCHVSLNTTKFCHVSLNTSTFCHVSLNNTKFCHVSLNTTKFCHVSLNSTTFCHVSLNTTKFCHVSLSATI